MKRPNRPSAPVSAKSSILLGSILTVLLAGSASAQLTLSGSSYLETFDGIASGLPLGWSGRTGATATGLGGAAALTTAATDWANSTGSFKNYASATGLAATANAAAQSGSSDRAFAIRQTGAVGDPGAAFTLQLANTLGFSNFAFTLDLEMLSVQTRSTTWTVQYGVGDLPSSFTTLYTYSDPGVFGTTTTPTLTLGADANNSSSNVWIRIVALAASTNSGTRDTFGIDQFSLSWTSASPDLYWDANGNVFGTGGTGTWDTTSPLWNTDSNGVTGVTTFASASKVFFSGVPGTVTVPVAGISANSGIQFDTSDYVIAGPGTLNLGASNINTTHAEGTTTKINAPIGGSAGLLKTGTGTLELGASNTFTGNVAIGGGRLRIAADNRLGATMNDVQLAGGTLEISDDVTLGVDRDLTGGGSIDVAAGKTLVVNGSASMTTLNLTNAGTVSLNGATKTVTDITLSEAGTLASNGVITANTVAYTSTTANGATISAGLDLGSATRTVTVADGVSDSDLTILGTVKILGGTNNRLHKLGLGTLRLEGDNGGTSGLTGSVRIGTAGSNPAPGGTVVITNNKALGDTAGVQVQFNAGTLRATVPMTGANAIPLGLSIGGGEGEPTTFAGSPMEFTGASAFFRPSGVTASRTLRVNTDLILSGSLVAATGNTSITGVSIDGSGSLTLNATTNQHNLPIVLNQASVYINGALTDAAATFTVTASGKLGGSGSIAGNTFIGLDGRLAPGTATNPESLEFGGTLDISGAVALGTGSMIFRLGSVSDSVVLPTSTLTIGMGTLEFEDFAFAGISGFGPGTYTLFDTNVPLDGTLGTALSGTILGLGASISTGDGGHDIVLTVVPEPGSAMLLLGGLGMLAARRRRKH